MVSFAIKSQCHPRIWAVLGIAAILVACSDSGDDKSGDVSTAEAACDMVGASEACVCPDGEMGERVCGDSMTFGACMGCSYSASSYIDRCPSNLTGENCDQELLQMEFIRIDGGTFQMGGETQFDSSEPIHEVSVPSFEMSKTEVTVGQYRQCMNAGVCTKPVGYLLPNAYWDIIDQMGAQENMPIKHITWVQAKTYAEFVGARLPTEAEWEFAATSRGTSTYEWGTKEADCQRGHFNDCGDTLYVVPCSFPLGITNEGLCDMAGNACEWVEDDYHETYIGAPLDGSAWVDMPRADRRPFRGCSQSVTSVDYTDFLRYSAEMDSPNRNAIGIRLARSIDTP